MDTATVTLRRATQEDKSGIWRVRTRAIVETCSSHYDMELLRRWSTAPMPAEFADTIESKDSLVAECDGVIAGFGFLDRDTGEVAAVFVAPDFVRRGIGGTLLRALEESATQAGLKRLHLSSTLNAVEFYKVAGFREIDRGRYRHRDGFELDCVLMEKPIAGPGSRVT